MTVSSDVTYYRVEVLDNVHKIKKWQRQLGYASKSLDFLRLQLAHFRQQAGQRGQTRGNEYRLVACNKRGETVEVLDD